RWLAPHSRYRLRIPRRAARARRNFDSVFGATTAAPRANSASARYPSWTENRTSASRFLRAGLCQRRFDRVAHLGVGAQQHLIADEERWRRLRARLTHAVAIGLDERDG